MIFMLDFGIELELPLSELRRLYTYIRPYGPRAVGALVGLMLSSLITLTLPYAIQRLVDSVFVQRDYGELNRITLALVILFIIQAVVSFSYRFLLQFVAQRAIADLRLSIHHQLLQLPLRFFTDRRVGDLVSRVSNDVTMLQNALVDAPVSLMRQLLTVLGGLGVMLWFNWQLTLIILVLIPPLMLVAIVYGKRIKTLSTTAQDRQADATVVLEEMLSGVRVVKSFVREQFEMQRYSAAIEANFAVALERARQRSIFVPLIALLGFGAICILLWYGGRQVIAGQMTPGELVAYLFYMIFVSGPMAESANLWSKLQEAAGASQRVFEIIDAEVEPGLTAAAMTPVAVATQPAKASFLHQNGAPKRPSQGQVHFVDVNFRYQDSNEDELPVVLQGINLVAEPGEVVALVGYSGAGKSTLVNLIPRFYDPTGGYIAIDGQDIRQLALHDLRSQIGLVPQETFLFGGTVRENIAYGRLNASDQEIEAAAIAAFAHDFISQLPRGYATIVGERGVKLSAGQRQRVAIARALLKDPRILILDEATSALDTESERWVQAALERLMEGRTSFVIAHRLSTIQRANRILVLDQGRIVESGNHEALLAQAGLYRRLHALQFTETPTESPFREAIRA
ncbi:MAG: ABC transporter transmembrane domain-containing protein [Caldilineaceae bacterium]